MQTESTFPHTKRRDTFFGSCLFWSLQCATSHAFPESPPSPKNKNRGTALESDTDLQLDCQGRKTNLYVPKSFYVKTGFKPLRCLKLPTTFHLTLSCLLQSVLELFEYLAINQSC